MFEKFVQEVVKGIVRAGADTFTRSCFKSYTGLKDKESKYDICKKHLDMSQKTLTQVDWIVLKSPVDENPFSLNLRGTNVTDQDLIDHLVGQKHLRRLDVCFCKDITYKGVRRFRKLRPDCQVLHNTVALWQYFLCFLMIVGTLINIYLELPF